ncbi:MAG: HEAT repeat domain-containing protein [Acidimicrobiia bacterium]|nr:HEAT repeat domain-containing protein [Acidimicrobiia bacterium]
MSEGQSTGELTALTPNAALRALSMAWSAYELYPNPQQQPTFVAAVETLAKARDQIITFEIGAGRITCVDADLDLHQGSTGRLALRLFVHDVERLEVIGSPSADDLHALFSELALDEERVAANGGIAVALHAVGVGSIDIVQRGSMGRLIDPWSFGPVDSIDETVADPGLEVARGAIGSPEAADPEVLSLVYEEASAEAVAAAITTSAAGDVDKIAAVFISSYEMIHRISEVPEPGHKSHLERMLAAYQRTHAGRSPLATFVEAFFLLPRAAQARILELFLEHSDRVEYRLLIDQFAGIDLIELAQLLSPAGYERLTVYIREVMDTTEGAPEELLPLVRSAHDVEGLRIGVSEHVAEMLAAIESLPSTGSELRELLRDELRPGRARTTGLEVVRDLFECETRSDRFDRLVKSWTDTLVMLIRDGRIAQAARVLRQGKDIPEHSPVRMRAIEEGLAALTATQHLLLVEFYRDGEQREALVDLLSSFGVPTVERLIERLALEEDPSVRRSLVGLLAGLGRTHPQPILDGLSDERWYLVRNLVAVVTKLQSREAARRLEGLLVHPDDRVVSESLRAMAVADLERSSHHIISALEHPVSRVHETALIVLRTSASDAIDAEIHLALLQRNLTHEVVRRLVETLRDRDTVEGRNALASLASMRIRFRRRRRLVRRVVREVLGANHE